MSILPIDGFISANGLQLHYRRWSPAKPGSNLPPILLIHGLASAARIWDFVAPLLAGRGYVVTALDQRGHGESDKPDTGYDFATIIADDGAAFKALAIARPTVAGHSRGAIGALQYPAPLDTNLPSLVLVH